MEVPEIPLIPTVLCERSLEPLLEDLAAILDEDFQVYAVLGPLDGLIAVKASQDKVAFGDSITGPKWARMTARERAEHVITWIQKAAKYYRAPEIRYAAQRGEAA